MNNSPELNQTRTDDTGIQQATPTQKEAPTITDQDQKEFLRLTRLLQEDIKRKMIRLLHTLTIPEDAWTNMSEDEHNSYLSGYQAAAWAFEDVLKDMK